MNEQIPFNRPVFPAAVAPEAIIDRLFSTKIQRYAANKLGSVLRLIKSIMVKGLALTFLIVKVPPLLETSSRVT